MELFLLRHAIAVARQGQSVHCDRERPLTRDGIRRLRRVAHGMRTLHIFPDRILTSSFLRARETAEIVAAELGCKAPEPTPHLEPGGDPESLLALLSERADAAQRILLVGHEPALSSLASMLLSGDARMQITMKKGGLCKLRIDHLRCGRCARLVWLLTPRQLISTA
jgi:phosphohistidine phosphatase